MREFKLESMLLVPIKGIYLSLSRYPVLFSVYNRELKRGASRDKRNEREEIRLERISLKKSSVYFLRYANFIESSKIEDHQTPSFLSNLNPTECLVTNEITHRRRVNS